MEYWNDGFKSIEHGARSKELISHRVHRDTEIQKTIKYFFSVFPAVSVREITPAT
jgi:hypothetical protein